jgi:hypothetical protein
MVVAALGPALTIGRVRAIMRAAVAFMLFALAVSPVMAYASVAFGWNDRSQISPDVARAATHAWRQETASPVRIVTGTETFSLALPFYSPDRPAEFTHYSTRQAPWITPERIAREGILFVCEATDTLCLAQAKRYVSPETKRVARRFKKIFWGLRGPEIEVVMTIVPPRASKVPSPASK